MLSSYTVAVTLDDASQPVPPADGRSTPGARLAGAALCFVVGAIYGAVGTVVHQNVVRIGDLSIPVALVLALVGATALLIGFRLLFPDRIAVLCAALGMVGTIALFSIASAGGSVLIPQGITGLVWTVAPVLISTVVVAWPRMPQRAPAAVAVPAGTPQAHEQHQPEA